MKNVFSNGSLTASACFLFFNKKINRMIITITRIASKIHKMIGIYGAFLISVIANTENPLVTNTMYPPSITNGTSSAGLSPWK